MSDRVTRREFAAGLLGSIAATHLSSSSDAIEAANPQPANPDKVKPSVFGGIQVGVQSYTFRAYKLDKMIEEMQSIGLSSVELWDGHLNPGKTSEDEFKAVKKKFDDAGIKVSAYCVNFPENSTDDYLDRGFNGALLLGTSVMTASVKKSIVPRLDQWCSKYKVKMGLHNHWFSDKWFKGDRTKEFETPDDFMNALKASSTYMNINLDIGHFYAAGFDPVEFIRKHHKRIVSIHIKDRDKDAEHTHRIFGKGATPIAESMALVKKLKWPYAANIEYELDAQNVTPPVRECFEYLKKVLS
jgi:sugar phosphate isomerase/epimerase